MPYIHSVSFFVRNYECDAAGLLTPSHYLRYMQEAAFGASAAVGYSSRRYAEIGLQWFAYETDFEHFAPAADGDTLTIRTWVVDFRRVRSLRQYEIYRDSTLIARARTDWVLIDAATGAPTTVPPEIVAAYAQGEDAVQLPRQDPLPNARPGADAPFQASRRVELRDIDPAGHVNNAIYVDYILEAARLADVASGVVAWQAGLRPHLARIFIAYKSPALLDDTLRVEAWASHLAADSVLRHFRIVRPMDGKTICQMRARQVWLDADGSAAPLPDGQRQAWAAQVVD